MKRILLRSAMAIACLVFSCSKKNVPPPDNGSGGTDDPGVTTTGNTTNNKGYIIKTIGISRIRVAVDKDYKITIAELLGGGNKVTLKAGSGNKMEYAKNNSKPLVDQTPDDLPNANLAAQFKPIDNGSVLDTTKGVTIKLKGFDKSATGYNQLNLVLCAEVSFNTGLAAYNFVFLDLPSTKQRSDYNNDFFTQLFTADINVSSVEMAKPLSEKPYIVRDMTMDGAIINASKADINNVLVTDFYNTGTGIVKLWQTVDKPLNVGGPLKMDLVNADKGTLSYAPFPDIYSPNTYFDPVFSNVKTGGLDQIVEPSDTTSKVFIRISGFDASICGFNQLRLFLTHRTNDPPEQLQYYNELLQSQLTLAYIKQSLQKIDMKCIQLITYW